MQQSWPAGALLPRSGMQHSPCTWPEHTRQATDTPGSEPHAGLAGELRKRAPWQHSAQLDGRAGAWARGRAGARVPTRVPQRRHRVQARADGRGVAQRVRHPGAQQPRAERRQRVVQQPQQRPAPPGARRTCEPAALVPDPPDCSQHVRRVRGRKVRKLALGCLQLRLFR